MMAWLVTIFRATLRVKEASRAPMSYAPSVSVVQDEPLERGVGKLHLLAAQPMFFALARDEVGWQSATSPRRYSWAS